MVARIDVGARRDQEPDDLGRGMPPIRRPVKSRAAKFVARAQIGTATDKRAHQRRGAITHCKDYRGDAALDRLIYVGVFAGQAKRRKMSNRFSVELSDGDLSSRSYRRTAGKC